MIEYMYDMMIQIEQFDISCEEFKIEKKATKK